MGRKKKVEMPVFDDKPIIADKVNNAVGSGVFIGIQTALLIGYIFWNILAPKGLRFDPFPFILCNLLLSFQAGYTGPFIVWSQNRAAIRDRKVMNYIRDAVANITDVAGSILRIEKRMDKDLLALNAKLDLMDEQHRQMMVENRLLLETLLQHIQSSKDS